MITAHCLIRDQPWYRRHAFTAGLTAAGCDVVFKPPVNPNTNTALVIWNRYGQWHDLALQVEAAGGIVIVAENGYIGYGQVSPKYDVHPSGPKPESFYCLHRGYHNGGGSFHYHGPQRFDALGLTLKPWRTTGTHVLIAPNRSFGPPHRVMSPLWAKQAETRYTKLTGRPVRVRTHPGNATPKRSIYEDLVDCWAVVIWSSSVGVHALLEGIPVFVEAPYWIMKGAAAYGALEAPVLPDRLPYFQHMASQQFTVEEIEAGWPFKPLLNDNGLLPS